MVLTPLQLNRTLLDRQMLLARARVKPDKAVARLVALQAQVASPPYLGLWARVEGFAVADLVGMLAARTCVRAALLRSTLHIVSARDYSWIRPLIQPALERAWQGFFGARKSGIAHAPLCEAARELLAGGPLSMSELSDGLLKVFPDWNKEAMEYGARTHLPLVQVPPAGMWRGGTGAKYALHEVSAGPQEELVRRYLAAFGPATARDVAAWAGFSAIGKTLESMVGELKEYRDDAGRKLYDLPKGKIVDGDAPVRFLPEYDNLVLGHADRSRILPEAYRKLVLLSAGRVRATVLVDGFVAGAWKIEREKTAATLLIEMFGAVKKDLLEEEGEALLRFAAPEATSYAIQLKV